MTTLEETLTWRGQDLRGPDGERIGTVEEIYLDSDTNEPEWALVHTGLFGTKRSFVPLRGASASGDGVTVRFDKAQVKDAPGIDPDGQLSESEEAELYRHYGMSGGGDASGSAGVRGDTGRETVGQGDTGRETVGQGDTGRETVGHDVSGPTTDDAMTRSEEELRVGTTERESGRVRLRKYVVEDQVTETVPVRREEVRIEREPITEGNVDDALEGPAISSEEHEVVLHEEEVVAEKRAVPKERVRLDTETVTEERQVDETVRREEIDVDGTR
jgi:uncharacterized protein (TIGR02271 family)